MQRAEPPRPLSVHVLLVGTDEETGRRIRSQLSQSFYRITTCASFNEAEGFFETEQFDVDLVLSSLEDEDGYNFISQIQLLRKNIPHVVIFGGERLVHHEVTRAYKLGACYVLQKPVSGKSDEIENLWKHAFRWRAQNEDLWLSVFRWRAQNEGSSSLVSSQQESLKRGYEFMNHGEEPSLRKQRMVWTEELDSLFVEVVNDLGEKAVPKQILDVMNQREPGLSLTREQVGSHLQKHREKEKKKQRPRRRLNNVNRMTVNQIPPRFDINIKNDVMASPLVSSSSSRRDMSHLHLPEASTTNCPVPQMQLHHYNQQPICQPMQFNNYAVTSLIGNGSSTLISEHQPDSHVNTTRPAMHQPDRITSSESNMPQQRQPQGPSFEGMESGHLVIGTSFRRSNMQQQPKTQNLTSSTRQLVQNSSSVSGIRNQDKARGTPFGRSNKEPLDPNHYLDTSFENSNMEQQLITQNLASSTQQPDQTSNVLIAPIRSGHDGMVTLEATDEDKFAYLSNQQFEVDVGDIFPTYGGFLDAIEDIEHPFQAMNETELSQLPNQ